MSGISIVTPSFRSLKWLPLCAASVADQDGVEVEHIVQDACSDDGTSEWLAGHPEINSRIEKDNGMYDAINRGLRRASGDILAYLNCDEQYLPGVLKKVVEYFDRHPQVQVMFADAVVVDPGGDYVCHRRMTLPTKAHTTLFQLTTLTCSTFFRKECLTQANLFFDPSWRIYGDAAWICQALDRGLKMGVHRMLAASFTQTGSNLSLDPRVEGELRRLRKMAPAWAVPAKPLVLLAHRFKRLMSGAYARRPFHYDIYTLKSPGSRQRFAVQKPMVGYKWIQV